jgi:predicted flap endonuclease-1-like 5' DNA nuclease
MNYPLVKIEGIGAKYAKILGKAGIKTTGALLKKARTRKQREELAKVTGISKKLILEWANLADLMRIKGIGEEWSDLLEEAGVDTVKELKNRKADNLYKAMVKINDKKKLVRRLPPRSYVKNWIKQAAKLKPILTY